MSTLPLSPFSGEGTVAADFLRLSPRRIKYPYWNRTRNGNSFRALPPFPVVFRPFRERDSTRAPNTVDSVQMPL